MDQQNRQAGGDRAQSKSGLTLSRNRITRPIARAMYLLVTMMRWAISLPSQVSAQRTLAQKTERGTSAQRSVTGRFKATGFCSRLSLCLTRCRVGFCGMVARWLLHGRVTRAICSRDEDVGKEILVDEAEALLQPEQ